MKSTKTKKVLRLLLRLCLCFGVTKAVTTGYPTTPSSMTHATDTLLTYFMYADSDSSDVATEGATALVETIEDEDDVIIVADFWEWKFSWTWSVIIQLFFACVGITGNLLVVLVVVRQRSSHCTDILIGALATADLLSSLCFIPLPRARVMPDTILGKAYCKLVSSHFYTWTCLIASTYTLVAMSCERLVAVTFPLRLHQIFSRRNVCVILVVIWAISPFFCSIFFLMEVRDGVCSFIRYFVNPVVMNVTMITVRMLIPVLIMIVTQIITAVSLHRQSQQLREALACPAGSKTFHLKARNRVVQMMFIVVAVFILSWNPVQISWFLVALGYIPGSSAARVRELGNLVMYINSIANPFIYAARYSRFRSAIWEIFVGVRDRHTSLFHP